MGCYPNTSETRNCDLALQKYMLLYTEQQTLREHLDQLRPLVTISSFNTPAIASPPPSLECYDAPFSSSPSSSPLCSSSSFPSVLPPVLAGECQHQHRRSTMPVYDCHERQQHRWNARRKPCNTVVESIADERTIRRLRAEEKKLFDVNECIKRMLTDLLNCEYARTHLDFRMWVQSRLMETERELRLERRRRSSAFGTAMEVLCLES